MAQAISIQEVKDMLSANIPSRDVEEYLVQGYGVARSEAQSLIKQALL